MPTSPTLAELVAAQQESNIFAFSHDTEARHVARLRAIYAKKRTELDALDTLFEETTPDFVLRRADGSELVLRLPREETREACEELRQALVTGLRKLEEEIVHFLLLAQKDLERVERKANHKPDLAPAILALCQPTALCPELPGSASSEGTGAAQETLDRTAPALGTAA
jgi:hypothetical protein